MKQQKNSNEPATVDRAVYANAYCEGYDLTRRFLLSRGVPSRSIDEAAQAAWARGWERRESLRNPDRLVTWINSIALNLFRNQLRKEKRCDELGEAPAIDPTTSASTSVDISRGLARCKPSDRKLLVQSHVEGYTSAELAKKWGCKPVAVRVRLMRARRRLALALRSASELKAPQAGQAG